MKTIGKNLSYLFIGALIFGLLCSRCANTQQGPSGGLKDTIPPVLLKTMPEQNAVNFKAKKIVLTFDENMAVKDASKNVVLSPPALLRPVVRRSGHTIQVVLQDTLQPNRTYTIDFGNSLVDNNEGNQFSSYIYVFSTGSTIDSMAFTGIVRNAYTLDPMGALTVMLYENLSDTAIYKTLPVAVARTDPWGYFSLQNIAPRTYRMIAIEDKNSNYRYDPDGETIAFLDSLVVPMATVSALPAAPEAKDTAALLARPYERVLLTSKENVRKQYLVESPQLGKREFKLIFNQYNPVLLSLAIEGVDSTGYIIERSRFNDTLTYWLTVPILPDTLRGVINYLKTDSLEQLSPMEAKLRFAFKEPVEKEEKKGKNKDEVAETPKLQPKISFNQQVGMTKGIEIGFDALPTQIDTTKIALFKVNTEKKTRTKEPFRWLRDTTLLRRFYLQTKWVTVTNYELEAYSGAFTDVYGYTNDSLVQKITTPNPDKYCHVTLNLSNVSSQYIVQIINTKKDRIYREIMAGKAGKIVFDYLNSGEYCIRFIDDANRNGIWDPCDVATKKQPEKVRLLRFSGASDNLVLKENFEINQDVDVEKLFMPELPHTHEKHTEDSISHEK